MNNDIKVLTIKVMEAVPPSHLLKDAIYKERRIIECKYSEEFKGKQISKLEDGQKVFFLRNSTFPRGEFKKSYPNNPIVYKVEECDVVIGKTFYLSKNYIYRTPLIDDESTCIRTYPMNYSFEDKLSGFYCVEESDISYIFLSKKTILDSCLFVRSSLHNEFLSEELLENLTTLVTSKTIEDCQIGVSLLETFDQKVHYVELIHFFRLLTVRHAISIFKLKGALKNFYNTQFLKVTSAVMINHASLDMIAKYEHVNDQYVRNLKEKYFSKLLLNNINSYKIYIKKIDNEEVSSKP